MKWLPDLTYLSQLPSTNYRIWVTVMLEVVYVLSILIMLAAGVDLSRQLPVIIAVGTFITAWLGLDVTQFTVKRKTHAPGAAATPSAGEPKP